jgi:hypothetical protein
MTENQKKIIKKLQWIFYPVMLLLIIDFFIKFFNHAPLETNQKSNQVLEWIDKGIVIVVFVIVSVGVIALMQQFFTKEIVKHKNTQDEANAKLLMKIEAPYQLPGHLILLIVALGFSVMLNIMMFSPQLIFEQEQLDGFKVSDKIAFGFFYMIAHFLVIVFGLRLFKGMPPVFIATEKGFCYEPVGSSTGWILWNDIAEVRESTVLQGSTIYNGQGLMPVLGIKLINPEEYNAAAYAPLLQRVVKMGQQLNNYQTEGVGDILLRPSDFGKKYETVLALFKEKSKSSFSYYSLIN